MLPKGRKNYAKSATKFLIKGLTSPFFERCIKKLLGRASLSLLQSVYSFKREGVWGWMEGWKDVELSRDLLQLAHLLWWAQSTSKGRILTGASGKMLPFLSIIVLNFWHHNYMLSSRMWNWVFVVLKLDISGSLDHKQIRCHHLCFKSLIVFSRFCH